MGLRTGFKGFGVLWLGTEGGTLRLERKGLIKYIYLTRRFVVWCHLTLPTNEVFLLCSMMKGVWTSTSQGF